MGEAQNQIFLSCKTFQEALIFRMKSLSLDLVIFLRYRQGSCILVKEDTTTRVPVKIEVNLSFQVREKLVGGDCTEFVIDDLRIKIYQLNALEHELYSRQGRVSAPQKVPGEVYHVPWDCHKVSHIGEIN